MRHILKSHIKDTNVIFLGVILLMVRTMPYLRI